MKWYLTVVWICSSWITKDAKPLFTRYWPTVSPPGRYVYGFFKLGFLSFIIDLEQFLYSLDSRPLSDTRFISIFCQFHGLSFHFPDVVLWSTNLALLKPKLSNCFCCLWWYIQKVLRASKRNQLQILLISINIICNVIKNFYSFYLRQKTIFNFIMKYLRYT